MSSKRYKRPSSARRNIKQEAFSPFVSLCRLRRIQSTLGNGIDSVLCISGIDSRYNEGTLELINYLLFGFFDVRKHELERSGFAEEVIDDMIFLIGKDQVDIYCNPINYNYLLPYTAHWRNLHYHCMTDEAYDDEEKAEEFKIHSFIAMTQDAGTIGIPYSTTGRDMKFDKMMVEKWPIIQAFALEGFGGGGFFTMKHEVVDMSTQLHGIYQLMDPVAVETAITEQLVLFQRQWDTMVSVLDIQTRDSVLDLTEARVCEPLQSYFSHGRVGSARGERSSINTREPFVLFGSHTSKRHLETLHNISTNATVKDTQAQHMIVQAVSPKGPLCCRRTYFFNNGVPPYPVLGKPDKVKEVKDIRILLEIYQACVESVIAAIDAYSHTLSVTQAESQARETLKEMCYASKVPLHLIDRNKVEFELQAFNNFNRSMSLKDGGSVPLIKTAVLTIHEIQSLESPGVNLGSVSFAESFLESTISVVKPDGSSDLSSEHVILTSHIPRHTSLQLTGRECLKTLSLFEHLSTQKGEFEFFGDTLMNGESALLLPWVDVSTAVNGKLYIYTHGLVFTNPHHGVVIIPKTELAGLHFYDGDSSSKVALIVCSYKDNVKDYIPIQLRSNQNMLMLAFHPKSKAYRGLYTEVLNSWKTPTSEDEPALQRIEDLPDEVAPMYKELQSEYELEMVTAGGASAMRRATGIVQGLKSFMSHFEYGCTGCEPVPSKHVPILHNIEDYDSGGFTDGDQLLITILTGLPGSGKEKLCNVLTKLSKDDNRWAILKHPADAIDMFRPQILQSSLQKLLESGRRKKSGASSKTKRVLYVTPGFADTVDIVQAIVNHPNKDVARNLKIGSITMCVDPSNAVICDRYTFPKLMDQCAQGWVNNVVFTCQPSAKNPQLDFIQGLVRSINADVSLLVSHNAEVTRSSDLELILSETAFTSACHVRARHLSCPGWWQGRYYTGDIYPNIKELILYFSQPLEKSRLMTRLKCLKSSHTKHPFTGNIYNIRGRFMFTESKQATELKYTVLNESLSLTPVDLPPPSPSKTNGAKPPYFIVFTGCALQEERLKDWLRECARQPPQRKSHRTKQSMTKTELNKLQVEHHKDPLPEGWFYNGHQFVSFAGDKSSQHPNTDEFIADFLAKTNTEVDAYNKKIDLIKFHDLFE